MELALYCPDCGFYEKENDTVGKRGDFITSVSVGTLFGELLAQQFAEWFDQMQCVDAGVSFQLIEAGAHDGQLARDILAWFKQNRPDLFEQITYGIIEPSLRRREWQKRKLEGALRVRWFSGFGSDAFERNQDLISPRSVRGVIFSNELLDAMPVHRFGWDGKNGQWFEWGVTERDKKFIWTRLASTQLDSNSIRGFETLKNLPGELLAVLPDGFTTEISFAAETWWKQAAEALDSGRLMTIDYGLSQTEFFAPHRANGTLRAYRQHRLCDDPLAEPGNLDLTAHVHFSAIESIGKQAGLRTEMFESQSRFLTTLAARNAHLANGMKSWTHQHLRQFQTLTHPELMGQSFQVLIQTR